MSCWVGQGGGASSDRRSSAGDDYSLEVRSVRSMAEMVDEIGLPNIFVALFCLGNVGWGLPNFRPKRCGADVVCCLFSSSLDCRFLLHLDGCWVAQGVSSFFGRDLWRTMIVK